MWCSICGVCGVFRGGSKGGLGVRYWFRVRPFVVRCFVFAFRLACWQFGGGPSGADTFVEIRVVEWALAFVEVVRCSFVIGFVCVG